MKTRKLLTEPQPFPQLKSYKTSSPECHSVQSSLRRRDCGPSAVLIKRTILGSVLFWLLFSVCFITALSYSPGWSSCLSVPSARMWACLSTNVLNWGLDPWILLLYQLSEALLVFYNFWKLVFFFKMAIKLGEVVHACKHSTWEAEAGEQWV